MGRGATKRSVMSTLERATAGATQQSRGIGKLVAMDWGTLANHGEPGHRKSG